MKGNFKRYVDQITQNVIALLHSTKTKKTLGGDRAFATSAPKILNELPMPYKKSA